MGVICSGAGKPWCEPGLCSGNLEHEPEFDSSTGKLCTHWFVCTNTIDKSEHKVRCLRVKSELIK